MSNLSGFVKRLRDIMRNDAGINGDAQRIEQIAWMLFLKVYDTKENDWEWAEEAYESIIPEPCRWRNWASDDKSGSAMTGDVLMDFVNNTLFPVLKGKDKVDSNGNVLIPGVKVTASTPIKKSIVQSTFTDANNYMKDGVLLRQLINVIDDLHLDDYEESHAFGEIYESILKELQSAGSSGEFYTPRAVTDFMAMEIQPKIGETMADFACGTGGFITSWLKELRKQVQTTADEEAYANSIYGIEKKQFPYMLCITNMLLHDMDVPKVYHANTLLHDVLDYTEEDKVDVILMNPPYGGSEKADVKNHFPDDLASSETADLFMSVIMYRLKKNGRAAVILPDGFLFGTDNAKINIKKKLLSEFNLHTIIRMPSSVFAPYTSITTNILFFDNTGKTEETWFYRMDMPEGYKHFSKTKPIKLEHFAPVIGWMAEHQELSVDGFDKAKRFTYQQLTEELGYNLDQCGYPHKEEEILAPMDLIQLYQEKRASLNAVVDRTVEQIKASLSTQEFAHHTEIVQGALSELIRLDSDFPKDMKISILQMAIQGKLVEPRPEEGTGEELYQQIQAEKQKLFKEGKIKKEKPLPEIPEDEIPFDIPESWKWVRWGDLSQSIQYGYNAPAQENGRIKMVRISDIQDGKVVWETVPYCEIMEDEIPTYLLGKNDILFARTGGTIGKSYLVKEVPVDAIYAGYLIRTRYSSSLCPEYLKYFMESALYWKQLRNGTIATAQPNCNGKTLSKMILPLPPFAEQKRIVAKLEEILPLCEKLK